MKIEHLGKEVTTTHFDGNVDMKVVNDIRDRFYNEDKDKALENINKIVNKHQTKTSDIYNYYFERVANDTIVGKCKWTINEGLQSNELVQAVYNKTLKNKKVFDSKDPVKNFKTSIRLGGTFFGKPTQFPIKTMRNLLDEFTNENDTYYDPCCGWGMRMLVSAEKGVKYIGNDINHTLINKLEEFGEDINKYKNFDYTLYEQGSEMFIPELENSVDFVFTSPPYFDLEVYDGSQGLKETSYQRWLEEFIRPMLENCYKYIKNNKYVAINIKNSKKYLLYDDTVEIGKEVGFKFVGERDLKQGNNRPSSKNGSQRIDSSEKIMILQKVE